MRYSGQVCPRVHELLVGGHPVVGYVHVVRRAGPRPQGPVPRGKEHEDLFLLLLMAPEANLGQARLQTAKAVEKLAEVAGWLT